MDSFTFIELPALICNALKPELPIHNEAPQTFPWFSQATFYAVGQPTDSMSSPLHHITPIHSIPYILHALLCIQALSLHMSSFTPSFHLHLGFPLFLVLYTSDMCILSVILSSLTLSICPNHFSTLSSFLLYILLLPHISLTLSLYLINPPYTTYCPQTFISNTFCLSFTFQSSANASDPNSTDGTTIPSNMPIFAHSSVYSRPLSLQPPYAHVNSDGAIHSQVSKTVYFPKFSPLKLMCHIISLFSLLNLIECINGKCINEYYIPHCFSHLNDVKLGKN